LELRNGKLLIVNDKLIEYLIIKPLDEVLVQVIYFSFLTHLQSSEKLKKLIGCVSLAYAFCANTGLYEHRKVQKIKIKKHGRKSESFSRKGLNIIRDLLKQTELLDQLIKKFVRIICINARRIIAKNDFLRKKY